METFYGDIKFSAEGNNIAKPMFMRQIQSDGSYKLIEGFDDMIFPRKVFELRKQAYIDIFPIPLIASQMGVFVANFMLSGAIVLDFVDSKNNVYLLCLILFIVQSTVAFIRTMFVRVE